MKFRFLVDVGSGPVIPAGDIRDLTPEEVDLYRGKLDNHLAPEDAEAVAFLKGETPKEEGPTRAELLEIAKKRNIKGTASMKKDDLVAALAEADEMDKAIEEKA